MRTTFTRLGAGFMAAALLASSALAMEAKQTVELEFVETQADGTQITRRLPADKVKPGERVVYTLDYINTQAEAASDLVLAMPIPSEVRFTEGTADRPGTRVEFSADGGQTYADRFALTVAGEDGTPRPAAADDITHVRWTLLGALEPGQTGAVGFKGRLK